MQINLLEKETTVSGVEDTLAGSSGRCDAAGEESMKTIAIGSIQTENT